MSSSHPFTVVRLVCLALVLCLCGCSQHLQIMGSTSIAEIEGRMLYLRVYRDGDMAAIDSARITHGRFAFNGVSPDTTAMVCLFLGEESVMPFVVDGSPLTITLGERDRKVEGSVLNDTLFAFIRRKSAIDMQVAELPRRESRMILDGHDYDDIQRVLNAEAAQLAQQNDAVVMRFIKDNMDNVLGPGVFMIVTSGMPYPMLNPQIEELVTLAPPSFLQDAYVAEFLRMARENQEKMME